MYCSWQYVYSADFVLRIFNHQGKGNSKLGNGLRPTAKQNIRRLAFGGVIAAFAIMIAFSAVNAQESGDAPPSVSVRQSDNETSTPITIDPPDSGASGSDDVTGQSTATAPNRPARPSRLRNGDITTSSIRIRWTAPADNGSPITGYSVRYQDRDGGGSGEVSASASSTSKVVSGLSSATRYNFEIKATNGEGDSDWSPNRYAHTKPGRVSTPSVTAGNGSLKLNWSAPSGGTYISSYKVQYKLTSASRWTSAGSSTTLQFTITRLTNGSRYHVQARACNRMLFVDGTGDNCGAWSSSATGTPQSPPTPTPVPPPPPPPPSVPLPPAPAPEIIRVDPEHVDAVKINWDVQDGAKSYRVRYRVYDDRDDWRVHGNPAPNPGDAVVTYIVDNIWDCKERYEIEISARGDGKKYNTGPGLRHIKVESPPCPITSGLQADHQIKWQEGDYPPPTPTTPLPMYKENPHKVFKQGIFRGANAWDGVPGLDVCMTCEDDYVITVNKGHETSCPDSMACLDVQTDDSTDHRYPNLVDMNMTFEEPGVHRGYEVYWTLNSGKHRDDVPGLEGMAKFYYIGAIAIHEFGHAVNIGDLKGTIFDDGDNKPSVMVNPHKWMSVTSHDRKYVKAVYYNHTAD